MKNSAAIAARPAMTGLNLCPDRDTPTSRPA
jgi:hypothetical protein